MGKTAHRKNRPWRDNDEETVPTRKGRKPLEDETTEDWRYIRSSKDVETEPEKSEDSLDKEKDTE